MLRKNWGLYYSQQALHDLHGLYGLHGLHDLHGLHENQASALLLPLRSAGPCPSF